MKIVITAGGGGHFSPALAVVEALPKDAEVLVIGRKHTFEGDRAVSFEYEVARKEGIPFVALTTGRLQRRLTRHSLFSLAKIPYGFLQAAKILGKFRPDVVVSFGGYVAVPVAYASWILRIPLIIHEQTLDAGLANTLTARIAKKICISWESSRRYFPSDKVILTGNPLRKEILSPKSSPLLSSLSLSFPLLYITGGSGGSHSINTLVERCLDELLERFIVVHQTGDARQYGDFERLIKKKEELSFEKKERYILTKFLEPKDQVGDIIKRAKLVITRAGMNTVSELLFYKKPAILIPLPFSEHNEQEKNALFIKEKGLGEVLSQKEVTPQLLLVMIEKLQKEKREDSEGEKEPLIDPNAADRIVEIIRSTVS